MTYGDSVEALRGHPAYDEIVHQSYLDEDVVSAAMRFEGSEEFRAVKEVLRLPRTSRIRLLDVGCGNGIAAYAFSRANAAVVAVDPDPSPRVGLDAAERLAALDPGFRTCRAVGEDLPFERESFDVVYARQALHHFQDLNSAVRECARVLRRNGLFLACREHVVTGEPDRQQFLDGHPLHALHGMEWAYRDEEYRRALEGAGLRIVRAFGPFDSVINHFPVRDSEVDEWLTAALTRRVGTRLGRVLAANAVVQRLYRARLSGACKTPGRMHSYLCLK